MVESRMGIAGAALRGVPLRSTPAWRGVL